MCCYEVLLNASRAFGCFQILLNMAAYAKREINGHPIEHFFTSEAEHTLRDARFRLGTYVRRFLLTNVYDAPDSDQLLLAVFAHLFESAQIDGPERKFSCIIRHWALHHPIQIPYRRYDQNTPQAVLNEFKARQNSVESVNLLDGPLYIEIVNKQRCKFTPITM